MVSCLASLSQPGERYSFRPRFEQARPDASVDDAAAPPARWSSAHYLLAATKRDPRAADVDRNPRQPVCSWWFRP